MNNHYPDRPAVKEESKALKVREKLENPEEKKDPGCLSVVLGEILGYIICIVLVILLFPLYSYWQDRKENKTRETMLEWIDTIDLAAQEDITTLNLELYILPDEDAWGNDIEVICTTAKNSYTISMLSPGDEDIYFDDVYERLTRNTKTNEVIRSQSEWGDILGGLKVIIEEETPASENKEPTKDQEPVKSEVESTGAAPPEEDSPGFLSGAKEKAGKAGSAVKNKAGDAKRGIKNLLNKDKTTDESSEEDTPTPAE